MMMSPPGQHGDQDPLPQPEFFQWDPRLRVLALAVNSMASAEPSAIRYRVFITLPWEFCIPRTTWRIWAAVISFGRDHAVQADGLGDAKIVLPVGFGERPSGPLLHGVQG